MLQFKLNDPTKMIYHNEPIIRENKIVGYLTSGNYGHTLGGCIGCVVDNGLNVSPGRR